MARRPYRNLGDKKQGRSDLDIGDGHPDRQPLDRLGPHRKVQIDLPPVGLAGGVDQIGL